MATRMPKDHRIAGWRTVIAWLQAHQFGVVAQTLIAVVVSHWRGHTVVIEWTGEVLDLTIHEVRDRRDSHIDPMTGVSAECFEARCYKARFAEPRAMDACMSRLALWAKEHARWLQ